MFGRLRKNFAVPNYGLLSKAELQSIESESWNRENGVISSDRAVEITLELIDLLIEEFER
jgi:hypothetical protein